MSDVYYTLQVDRCGAGDEPGKWRLTVVQWLSNGSSIAEKRLHLERLFDSQEGAAQYAKMWTLVQSAPVIHPAAITPLRLRFRRYGFDVSAYSNDQLTGALLEEAATNAPSSEHLFGRAFQRLKQVKTNQV